MLIFLLIAYHDQSVSNMFCHAEADVTSNLSVPCSENHELGLHHHFLIFLIDLVT